MSSEAKTADKIFIEQILIYERNVQGKIRLLYQLGAETITFLYFYIFPDLQTDGQNIYRIYAHK